MRELLFLVAAALFEVGGDALVRLGVRGGRPIGFLLGAIVLFIYGLAVNIPKWDFGKMLGVYISLFFVVSQVIAVIAFHEKLRLPTIVGGALILAGGVVITVWRIN